jgi:hypothetical protein
MGAGGGRPLAIEMLGWSFTLAPPDRWFKVGRMTGQSLGPPFRRGTRGGGSLQACRLFVQQVVFVRNDEHCK